MNIQLILPLAEPLSDADVFQRIRETVIEALSAPKQPSPHELVRSIHEKVGVNAHWDIVPALRRIGNDTNISRADRDYCNSLVRDEDLTGAMLGTVAPGRAIESTLDQLMRRSKNYRGSAAFAEMITFMTRFRDYSPYNNLLVRLQNPSCSFFATESDWLRRFGRTIKEDASPMLILAPMRPLICVYDMDHTEGRAMPAELDGFANFEGEIEPEVVQRMIDNAERRDRIRVNIKKLSSSNAGFATFAHGPGKWKMRIALHDGLDLPSRFGVLCHELAHIYLGHLGTDSDHWWPARSNMDRHSIEIEAESVAHLVSARLGLAGASHAYVSRHLRDGEVPPAVSIDLIAKVAGRIEQMAQRNFDARKLTKSRAVETGPRKR